MKLYGYGTPNVLKVNILLEELDLRYDLQRVDIWRGEQFEEGFVALNPNSKIPVLVDPDDRGGRERVIFESGAILFYLAEKTGRFFGEDAWSRTEVMQWLMFQMGGLGPMSGQFNHFRSFAPAGNDYALSRYTTEMRRLYGVIERRLEASACLGGDAYSIADMAVYPWIRNQSRRYADLGWTKVQRQDFPRLSHWFETLGDRPAIQRAVHIFDGIGSTFSSATADDLDKVFGRGRYATG